jgi:hypothetical protein
MQRVNAHEAKKQVANLLDRVAAGAEEPPPGRPGALKGKLWIADNFDELDEELEDMFYGSDE